jgi:hypothetical protein
MKVIGIVSKKPKTLYKCVWPIYIEVLDGAIKKRKQKIAKRQRENYSQKTVEKPQNP